MKPNIHPEYRTVVFHDTSIDEYFTIPVLMSTSGSVRRSKLTG
ncbi:hypothetical protein CPQ19_003972 [Escherichia coli]|nr:hypothetical protein [Escherichia coli]EER3074986.1 hypothetical protein [Escherichia coli]EEV8482849.1 hypothetical protein [Escherichia coli]EEW7269948.1 hypothetical protein [Escherichia coli]EEW8612110.1 hypothetical protein [Escherichia coli]